MLGKSPDMGGSDKVSYICKGAIVRCAAYQFAVWSPALSSACHDLPRSPHVTLWGLVPGV